jgi:hypothetical protein
MRISHAWRVLRRSAPAGRNRRGAATPRRRGRSPGWPAAGCTGRHHS